MWPSIVFGALVPLAVYYIVRHKVGSDATALIIAGLFPAAWVITQFIRQRRVDVVGLVVLAGFLVGVLTSTALGGNAYVLKVRDAAFTAVLGLACLVTVFVGRRPAIFYIGRMLSAGNDPERVAAYDQLHELPTGRRTFRILSLVWGIALVVEAGGRFTLAAVLSTGTFLAVSPFVTGICIGGAFLFTVRYSTQARTREMALLPEGQSYPSVPLR